MPHRIFYRQHDDGASIEVVALDEPDTFRIRIDRPGMPAASTTVLLADLQEMADLTWHDHVENGTPPPPEPE